MQIKGKARIANKFIDGKLSDQFDFDNRGKFATGRLSWSFKKKDKVGTESWQRMAKKFISFGDNIVLFESSLGQIIEIEGYLENNSFQNSEGKTISYDVIKITNIIVDESKKESNPVQSDEIPF